MKKSPVYAYRRKPGMFCNRRSAAAKISVWVIFSASIIAFTAALAAAFIAHPNIMMRSVFATGFAMGAFAFIDLARVKSSRGMKIFSWLVALDLLVLAVNCAGVLR